MLLAGAAFAGTGFCLVCSAVPRAALRDDDFLPAGEPAEAFVGSGLLQTTCFVSHSFCVELTLPRPRFLDEVPRKNKLPKGALLGFVLIVELIYHIFRENQCG